MFDFGNANVQQREAITTTEGPLLIIAGPGTGKTFTLVNRIVYLITEKGLKPEEIMVATFTEKAAKELVTRITNELYKIGVQVNLNEMYVGTFHSICLRIIKEHLEYTRIKKNYRMLDQFDQQYLIFQNIKRFQKCTFYDYVFPKAGGVWAQAQSIAKFVNNLLEELVDVDAMLRDTNPKIIGIANILKLYEQIAEEENLIDFSSIQTEAYHLLKKHPEILSEIQDKIKYVMVDEYQDTNYIQELIVFLIAGEKKNICVVGDDDQGLYRFRGATIRNILEFPSHFADGECNRVDLTTNYRSEKEIIDFYNNWMSSNNEVFDWQKFRFPKTIIPGKTELSNGATVLKCSSNGELNNWFESVYDFITILKENSVIKDYNQIAFLSRSVKNVRNQVNKVVELIKYLEGKGIPVYSPRSEMFFERVEIQQLLGCLLMCFPKYLENLEEDNFSFKNPGLHNYYRICLGEAEKAINNSAELEVWIEATQERHADMYSNTDYAFTGLFYQLLQFEPFRNYVGINLGNGVTSEREARNISILSSVLGKYEYLYRIEVFTPQTIETIPDLFFNMYMRFLKDGGITEYEDESEYAPSGCVSFMTIHQSKGMEFPIVMVDSLSGVPKTQSDEIVEEVEEKYFNRPKFEMKEDIKYFDFWRLYYTAFSRAQNLLVLSCHEKSGSGRTPSKYFEPIYKSLPSYKDIDFSIVSLAMVKPVNIKQTFSFTSHIELYENCSLQYKFFKELGFAQVRVGATLFGTLVHETIEDVHRAAMRHEESTINPENIRKWLDTNYTTLSKSEHSYLGAKQVDAAYKQVLSYVERMEKGIGLSGIGENGTGQSLWNHIQEAEVDVSLVKPEYILHGTVDLITGEGNTVEIVDFKSEKRPDSDIASESFERYKRQLEVYAHLVEERTGKKVSRMHLYYTGEDKLEPTVTFMKSKDAIDATIKKFDLVVAKIQNHEFSTEAKSRKSCLNCDMRYFCKKVN